ncbi:MAG: sigma-54 dependent transcriptional regulator [Gammaproteobacteria bacterium]|nr:sigma-54 dependent transcriptional regulator [Gammaproteobacteria bacterium]
MTPLRVLIIEDERTFANNIATYLTKSGFSCRNAYSGNEGIRIFREFSPQLVLLDISLGDMSGIEVLKTIRASNANCPVIMMTAYGSIDIAVEAMKSGANEFLTKPVSLKSVRQLIVDILTGIDAASLDKNTKEAQGYLSRIVGQSKVIKKLKQEIRALLKTEGGADHSYAPPVLIVGETGTGKELIAQALHYEGKRSKGPFVEINCTTLPESLVESELFGHEKGAFTGAISKKQGLFEAAHGGTLFLDEIGDMPMQVQLKLLKVLEDKEVRPLGSLQSRKVDVRIVAASNRPLDKLVDEGSFRADLYFRLSIIQIESPPLRERGGDITLLARHFLQILSNVYQRPVPVLTDGAIDAIQQHTWPGNVRELRNLMEKQIVTSVHDRLLAEHLKFSDVRKAFNTDNFPEPSSELNLHDTEKQLLLRALDKTAWNVSAAAKILGVTRDTLRYRMKRYGLQRKRDS